MIARKDALELAEQACGERSWKDKKGTWKISQSRRLKRMGNWQYESRVELVPDPEAGLKTGLTSYTWVMYYANMPVESFRRQIKQGIGYTPSLSIQYGMMEFAERLRLAHEEADQYYASQDKDAASAVLESVLKEALNRYRSGEVLPERYSGCHKSDYDRYVSEIDKCRVDEAIRVINGSAYMEEESGVHGGHTHDFRKQLSTLIEEQRRHDELRASREHYTWLSGLLETDPEFRRLVAHAMGALKTKRSSSHCGLEYELAYRLFGYQKNLDGYRRVYAQLDTLMQAYRLKTYDAQILVRLGREYVTSGGMLPAVTAPYERGEGIYYGDWMTVGKQTFEVRAVGRVYVYLSNGSKIPLRKERVS